MIEFILGIFVFLSLCGGFIFYVFAIHDIFCPIGKEYLFQFDSFRKDKTNLRWNKKGGK